jgi:hypothetical protein
VSLVLVIVVAVLLVVNAGAAARRGRSDDDDDDGSVDTSFAAERHDSTRTRRHAHALIFLLYGITIARVVDKVY